MATAAQVAINVHVNVAVQVRDVQQLLEVVGRYITLTLEAVPAAEELEVSRETSASSESSSSTLSVVVAGDMSCSVIGFSSGKRSATVPR